MTEFHPDVHDTQPEAKPEYHAMIDIETLATTPNAVVVSIGVAIYDPQDDLRTKPACTAHFLLNPTEQLIKGRAIDPETVKWWSQQNEKAIESITVPGDGGVFGAGEALQAIRSMFDTYDVQGVWGNGSDFDNVIVNDLCRTVGIKEVIHFRKQRCYRTLRALFGDLIGAEALQDRADIHHNALSDALYQMRQHKRIHAELRKRGLLERYPF